MKRPQNPVRRPKPDLRDDGYDGYYDDITPVDDGYTRDRLDPKLIKRAVLVSVGALLLILLSVIIMTVL